MNYNSLEGTGKIQKLGRNPKCDRNWCENEIKKELKLEIVELKLELKKKIPNKKGS